ncbi:MAG: hypothetical protein DRH43_04860 [Deltaproteobacteria bacterium]|nr:MAG: hypothetical protein DRH43_04860 [Deltaproteobacteria bacterium]
MGSHYPESKVEVHGCMARHYDALLTIATFGQYVPFIRKSIALMDIRPEDRILDLGTGTGRNACLMTRHLSNKGKVIGLDISQEMISQFKKRCVHYPNAKIIHARVDQSLPLKQDFDKVFISFVLHGFPQQVRELIIKNAFEVLKGNGEFFILDYNEFSYKEMPFYLKRLFKLIECPYAFDFIERDWKGILRQQGFDYLKEHHFFQGYIRLLSAKRVTDILPINRNAR